MSIKSKIKQLKVLVTVMEENGLSELNMGGYHLKRGNTEAVNTIPRPRVNEVSIKKAVSEHEKEDLEKITSPMVGIVYLRSKPDQPSFVSTGQNVKKGQTVCLVEAMKTFNEIKASRDGKIVKILVKDGSMIEFGTPLFSIK
ncbi:MAG: hypothetical protein JJV93_02640 [Alphaproteobacteria bacterium]|nr:hypothetical protein [Alphaproteobacteria bacterium]MBL0718127.1 hypothetical protein [Alphaproteobacteria bacterium]